MPSPDGHAKRRWLRAMMLSAQSIPMPPLSTRVLTTGGSTFVANSTIEGAGRGVFAAHAFDAGEHIAREPILDLGAYDGASDVFSRYAFDGGSSAFLVLGVGSLINHDRFNLNVHWRLTSAQWFDVFAIRPIAAGEELRFDYGRAVTKTKRGIG